MWKIKRQETFAIPKGYKSALLIGPLVGFIVFMCVSFASTSSRDEQQSANPQPISQTPASRPSGDAVMVGSSLAILPSPSRFTDVTKKSKATAASMPAGMDVCVCPACGTIVRHPAGIPCKEILCPNCGSTMYKPGSVEEWRFNFLRPFSLSVLGIVVLLVLMHYAFIGHTRRGDIGFSRDLIRFKTFERVTHLCLMSSFLALAVLEIAMIAGLGGTLKSLLGSEVLARSHAIAGGVFAAGIVLSGLVWAKDGIFMRADLPWLRRGGGYFGPEEEIPAGKFNAGQKIFFWFVLIAGSVAAVTGFIKVYYFNALHRPEWIQFACKLHDLACVLLMAGVVGHLYMSTLANPGGWRTIFDGRVSHEYAKKHHSLWTEEIHT